MINKLVFYLTFFNHSVDLALDGILNKQLDSGISECTSSRFYINITFKTGVKAILWNENKWYGWLSEGNIGNYTWNNVRPRRKTMWRLKKEIEKYFIENHV